MSTSADIFDVVVVGAGAAGLAALRRLRDMPLTVLALEARNRPGGRAWTNILQGLPLDMGCGWLHSADVNPLPPVARQMGFTVDDGPPGWARQAGNRGFSAADQQAYADALTALESRMEQAAAAGREGPASDYLEAGNRWNPLLDAFSSFFNGVEFDAVSIQDYAAYADSGVNWRIREGYGAAIAALGTGSAIRFDAPVSVIDRSARILRLETPHGVVAARTAIVTLPTPLIAAERLQFRPALPEKVEAASRLPLGLANKLFLATDRPEMLPQNGHVFGRTDRTATAGYHLRPFGRPYIEGFFGGRNARALERMGERAFVDFAVNELAGLFGGEIRKHLTPIVATGWSTDRYAMGSYSHALPGFAGARSQLAAPVDDRLFFAGEACSAHAFSTAHGAFETGIAAAEQAFRALSV